MFRNRRRDITFVRLPPGRAYITQRRFKELEHLKVQDDVLAPSNEVFSIKLYTMDQSHLRPVCAACYSSFAVRRSVKWSA